MVLDDHADAELVELVQRAEQRRGGVGPVGARLRFRRRDGRVGQEGGALQVREEAHLEALGAAALGLLLGPDRDLGERRRALLARR